MMGDCSAIYLPVHTVCRNLIECLVNRVEEDELSVVPKNTIASFSQAWEEKTNERLLLTVPVKDSLVHSNEGVLPSQKCTEYQGTNQKKRKLADSTGSLNDSGNDLTGVCQRSKDTYGVFLCEEELEFLRIYRLEEPLGLDCYVEKVFEDKETNIIIGHLEKVTRPGDTVRRPNESRPSAWTVLLKQGLVKVRGQEFVFDRLEAELREP